jgi:putative FmdB family regulatory protein
MPAADFKCRDCGFPVTVARPTLASDVEPPLWCNACGGTVFKRVFHAVGVILKGSGWASK